MNIITKEQAQKVVPSIFNVVKDPDRSKGYKLYNTEKIVNLLAIEGYLPVKAMQQGSKDPANRIYQKHMLRFRHLDDLEREHAIGSEIFEIVLTNSHNGKSAYNISIGIFRLVCLNGLVVGSSYAAASITHMHTTPRQVVQASLGITKQFGVVRDNIERMRSTVLDDNKLREFADKAYAMRWKDISESIPNEQGKRVLAFHPSELLNLRRKEDRSRDLWTTMNVVQENMIKGFRFGIETTNGWKRPRGISAISENLRINKGIWNIAQSYLN